MLLFFILSPGVLPALWKKGVAGGVFRTQPAAAAVAASIFGVVLYVLERAGMAPTEAFQLRGAVGAQRNEGRRRDANANPVRTCATEDDCKDNETRKFCEAAVCRSRPSIEPFGLPSGRACKKDSDCNSNKCKAFNSKTQTFNASGQVTGSRQVTTYKCG